MAESEEEQKSLLMTVEEESEKVGLKLNIPLGLQRAKHNWATKHGHTVILWIKAEKKRKPGMHSEGKKRLQRCYLRMVSICISLVISGVEYIFMYMLDICISLWQNI